MRATKENAEKAIEALRQLVKQTGITEETVDAQLTITRFLKAVREELPAEDSLDH